MDAAALMRTGNPRLLGFMFHDRVAYGGSLLSIGLGYMWLAGVPLARREAWAWWTVVLSGAMGFLGFLTYLDRDILISGTRPRRLSCSRFLSSDCGAHVHNEQPSLLCGAPPDPAKVT